MARSKQIITGIVGVGLIAGAGGSIVYQLLPDPPPASPPARVTPVLTPEAKAAVTDPQDAAIEQAMHRNERYVRVPAPGASSLRREPGGRVWVQVFDGSNAADLKRSIERAARGLSRVIRGGKLVLVDGRGRYWAVVDGHETDLLCYDGVAWLPPHGAGNGTATTKTAWPARFVDAAVQNAAGDCFFVSGGDNVPATLHRFSNDGVWTATPFPAGATVPDNVLMAEQTGGRVAVYTAPRLLQGAGTSMFENMVLAAVAHQYGFPLNDSKVAAYLWDGHDFFAAEPPERAGARMNQAVPLPDGSIMTTYQGIDRVTPAWPRGAASPRAEAVARLVVRLDDPDPSARTAAMTGLLNLGPSVAPLITAARKDPANAAPLRQDALEDIAARLTAAADPNQPPEESLFAGRYQLTGVVQASVSFDGSVRLFAKKVVDVLLQETSGPSLVTIDRHGQWRVRPVPDGPDLSRLPEAVQTAFEDTRGSLWVDNWLGQRDKRVIDLSDFSVRPALPVGLDVEHAETSDRDGRVYFTTRGGDWIVYNPDAPAPRPGLPLRLTQAGTLVHRQGETVAFVLDTTPSVIGSDGSVTPIPPPHDMVCQNIRPLRGGAAIVNANVRGGSESDTYRFLWDGQKYLPAIGGSFRNQVAAESKAFMRCAPTTLIDPPGEMSHEVASDRGQGLWCLNQETSLRQILSDANDVPTYLQYCDGSAWYDVWDLFKSDPPRDDDPDAKKPTLLDTLVTMGTVDGGHTLLVYSKPKHEVAAVVFDGDKLTRRSVLAGENLPVLDAQTISSNGTIWFWTRQTQGPSAAVYRYDAGRLKPLPWRGEPRFADAADRLWCVQGKTLAVVTATQAGGIDVPDLDDTARVTQSPDGRLYLLHASGIEELHVDGATPHLGRHWSWGAPANQFDTFCDTQHGLWLGGNGGRVGRYELP